MKCETLRNYIFSVISVGGHFQVLSGLSSKGKATESCEFFLGLTWVRRGGRHRHSQLQPPRPSHLLFSLPTTPSFSPSSKYTLQASTSATGAMCTCFAALPFHPPLIVCHHMSERLNIRPKQSVYQLNIFCRDLCFCNTTSTIKPFKPSK